MNLAAAVIISVATEPKPLGAASFLIETKPQRYAEDKKMTLYKIP
jgi:hypothetical protein